ncbi:plasmid pRiA4b ORF-3 family protein [Leuconostoc pseudomesenteroides]|uniref:plasmid pRiA4b ORF-3 family protein n=1 Tax=Leuconostoc pseudomesenteroides TaxID=33968 RepID=UPI001E44EA40|nr:plasmid pRiA4b ORF-3 family protein [Leuconostoc pseudomesenteroides]
MATHNIYELDVTLKDFEPKITRTLLINGERTLAYLAYTLIASFEFHGSHLFEFNQDLDLGKPTTLTYAFPIPDNLESFVEEGHQSVLSTKVDSLLGHSELTKQTNFIYDFGDYWEFDLKVKSVQTQDISLKQIPTILAGQGFGLIEDIGGVSGLHDYSKAFKTGNLNSYHEWLGDKLPDIDSFDITATNKKLKTEISLIKGQYEDIDWL